MYEKVNPKHPDKVADRIAGAIVDLGYKKADNPKIACEVLLGHRKCLIINETSERFGIDEISKIVKRIAGDRVILDYKEVRQDFQLMRNQLHEIRCGDNGIFKGVPVSKEEIKLTKIAKEIYKKYKSDGKYIINNNKLIICQSKAPTVDLAKKYKGAIINPLGNWEGGTDVDSGATNRKLGSDMGRAVTGGGLHGKDLSKADVSINIYCHLKAQKSGKIETLCCAIGDEMVDGKKYSEIVEIARKYIKKIGGFEKLAEWGLIR